MPPGRCPVSVEAISWALNLASVPADRGGQPSSACKFVLVGLANHAGPDGSGAFPSVGTLVRCTGLSERTVRTCLDRLAAGGIVSPCDPGIVAARIKRADRRPQGWNLNLSLVRDDLDDAAIAVLEHQFPGLGIRLAAAAPQGADGQSDGVQSPHPESGNGEAVDNRPDGVQPLHPEPGPGCNQRSDGVQPAQPRGAGTAPEPSREPSTEPSAASVYAGQVPATAGMPGGDQSVGEFSPDWAAAGRSLRTSGPGSYLPCRPRSTRAGCRRRWRRSLARTPPGYVTRTRYWPPGFRPPSCPHRSGDDRPGLSGAASATRLRGCSASTVTRHPRARAANQRLARSSATLASRPSWHTPELIAPRCRHP
jgi:Helix-turn-helix domain